MPDEDDLYCGASEDNVDAVTAVAASPDGRIGATGARCGEIRLWDLRHGLLTAYVGGLQGGPVDSAAFIGDGERPTFLTTGPSASLWTVTAEALEWRRLPWDGVRLLTSSDREAVLRQCGDLRWPGAFGPFHGRIKPDSLMALGRTRAGLIVASGDDGRIEAWRRPEQAYGDAELVWAFGGRDAADQRLTRCCDRWRLVVSPRRGRVVVLDAETGTVVTAFAPPARPTAIAAHPDRPLVVLGGRDGSLSWWDARSGHRLGRVQAHGGRVRALALATGTDLVMSAAQDGTAALWRLHGRRPVGRFAPPTPSGPPGADPCGRYAGRATLADRRARRPGPRSPLVRSCRPRTATRRPPLLGDERW